MFTFKGGSVTLEGAATPNAQSLCNACKTGVTSGDHSFVNALATPGRSADQGQAL